MQGLFFHGLSTAGMVVVVVMVVFVVMVVTMR
jgi:hypothetical protein